MNMEDRMVRNIDRKREHSTFELSPEMARAYEKTRRIFSDSEFSLHEIDFIRAHGQENVAADMSIVERMAADFKTRDTPEKEKLKRIADISEAMILTQAKSGKWFGDVSIFKTSAYDDYINGTDMILEWFTPEEGSRVLALAVDVTFSVESIEKKLTAIKIEIDNDELGSLKYFRDNRGNFVGIRNNIPRIVVGVSEPVIEELADLWVREEHKALDEHPIQILFLDEMVAQLQFMRKYALKKGKTAAVGVYDQVLQTLVPIREKKLNLRKRTLLRDGVATEIAIDAQKVFCA